MFTEQFSRVFYSDGHYEPWWILSDHFHVINLNVLVSVIIWITYVWKEKYLVWEFPRRVSHVISGITGEYEG